MLNCKTSYIGTVEKFGTGKDIVYLLNLNCPKFYFLVKHFVSVVVVYTRE